MKQLKLSWRLPCWAASLFLFTQACQPQAEQATNSYYLQEAGPQQYAAQLDTAAKGRLVLRLQQPAHTEIRLLQGNGRTLNPEFSQQEGEATRWYFQPINNPCLYHFTGKEGQLPDRFSFLVRSGEQQDTLTFALRSSEAAGSKEQVYVYLPEKEFQQSFHAEANHYVQQLGIAENSVHWTEQELLIAGLNLRYSVYEEKDTLWLTYRLVNRSKFPLQLTQSPFQISNASLQAVQLPSEQRQIAPGERASGKQAWLSKHSPGELYLLAKGIRLQAPDTLLIGVPLHLVRKSEKELPCRY